MRGSPEEDVKLLQVDWRTCHHLPFIPLCHTMTAGCLKKSATNHSTFGALLVKLMERFHHKHAPVINHLIKMKHLRWSTSTIIQGEKTVFHTGQRPFKDSRKQLSGSPAADDRCCWAPLILLHVLMFIA